MKIPLVLSALILGAPVAFGGRFDLPKENPYISVKMPENWQTRLDGEKVTARPADNAKVMISVFAVPGASNLEDAFAVATKYVGAIYRDVKIGKLSRQNQNGINFFGGQGEGEKDGFELILAAASFSPDGKHFFGLAWARDEVSGDAVTRDIDKALASIQPFKETSKPQKIGPAFVRAQRSGFTGKCLFFRFSGTRSVRSFSISSVAAPSAS